MKLQIWLKSGQDVVIDGVVSIKAFSSEKDPVVYDKDTFQDFICRAKRTYNIFYADGFYSISGESIDCVHFIK